METTTLLTRWTSVTVWTGVLVALLFSAFVQAQDKNSDKPDDGDKQIVEKVISRITTLVKDQYDVDSGLTLEEVIVTAQKRVQSLQDVPVAVSVMSGEKLKDAGIQDLEELSAYVPNFMQTTTTTSNLIFIRGIGSGDNLSFEQSVGVFHDGVYWGRGRQTLAPLYDLDRLEVLKGPQGVLFGKNTIAGTVSSTSARPTEEFSGELMTSGSNDGQKIQFAVSGPLTDWLRARIAVHDQSANGWIENEFTAKEGPEKDTTGTRLGFEFDVGETLMGYLKLEWSSVDIIGTSYELIQTNIIPFSFLGSDAFVPPHQVGLEASQNNHTNYGNATLYGRDANANFIDLANHVLQLDWSIGEHTVTSVTGYSSYRYKAETDLDFSPADIAGISAPERYRQISQEFRIQSPVEGSFDYIGGLYGQSADLEMGGERQLNPASLLDGIVPDFLAQEIGAYKGTSTNDFDQETQSISAFFQGSYHFNDSWSITLGARYTVEKKEVDKDVFIYLPISDTLLDESIKNNDGDYQATGNLDENQVAMAIDLVWGGLLEVVPYTLKDDRTERQFIPQLTVEWSPEEETMFYASAKRGFKGGGYDAVHANGNFPEEVEFEEETAVAYELGVKTQLLAGRLGLNAAIFQTKFEDQQVSIFNGISEFNVFNAGAATSRGLEIEGRFLLTANLLLNASVAFNDFAFDDYKDGQCTLAQQADIVEDFNTDGDISQCKQDLSGKDAVLTPDKIASVGVIHTYAIGPRLQFLSTLDANYTDEYFLAGDLDPVSLQDSYTKLNLRLALEDEDSGWQIAFLVKNLTDEQTLFTVEDGALGNGNSFSSILCGIELVQGIPGACDSFRTQLVDRKGSYFAGVGKGRNYSLEGRLWF